MLINNNNLPDGDKDKKELNWQDTVISFNHTYNVRNVFSMGTAFNGSKFNDLEFAHTVLGGAFTNYSADDILDPAMQQK